MLTELIALLTCQELDPAGVRDIERAVAAAPDEPALSWAGDAPLAKAVALVRELGDYLAVSDQIATLHEQIAELFADPLPPLKPGSAAPAYFGWLERELAKRGRQHGGYAPLLLDPYADDQMYVAVVYRRDADRVMELAAALAGTLDIRIARPAAFYPAP